MQKLLARGSNAQEGSRLHPRPPLLHPLSILSVMVVNMQTGEDLPVVVGAAAVAVALRGFSKSTCCPRMIQQRSTTVKGSKGGEKERLTKRGKTESDRRGIKWRAESLLEKDMLIKRVFL
ncbi:hypothetical protein DPEC_G00215810 [Dallia pectoralis]|uniref:Uncharacterized protein n=1 Tax=Dallia pectoralis TaxID=75939 RepID=A0ACC2G213_DALPE|nr:hypothetical protein DPEC_G00215810 [Dallia pectoralis]